MKSPDLLRPSTAAEAAAMLTERRDEARAISGGTALVPLTLEYSMPSYLVALYRIPNLDYIRYDQGSGLRIGALASLRDVETSLLVRRHAPVLSYTISRIASVRVRTVATIGGSLADANYASDPYGVLISLDAKVKAVGISGERTIRMRDLIMGHRRTTLQQGEVVVELFVPETSDGTTATYTRYTTHSQKERPAVGVAALAKLDGSGTCEDLRVVVTAVAGRPQEITEVEQLALGEKPSSSLICDIALRYSQQMDALEDHRASAWYRRQLTEVLVRRVLENVLGIEGA